jgi:hypothetical protein
MKARQAGYVGEDKIELGERLTDEKATTNNILIKRGS